MGNCLKSSLEMRWDFWRRAIQIGIFDWPVPTYVPWRAFCGWCCESIGYRDGGQDGSFALAAFLVRSPLTNRIKEWTQMSVAGITGQNFNETQFILLLLFYVFIVFFQTHYLDKFKPTQSLTCYNYLTKQCRQWTTPFCGLWTAKKMLSTMKYV